MTDLQMVSLNGLGESFSLLTSKVLNALRPTAEKSTILGVTSYLPGEGVSSTTVRLALAMSQRTGARTLVIDSKLDNIARSGILPAPAPEPEQALVATSEKKAVAAKKKGGNQMLFSQVLPQTRLVRTRHNLDILLAQSSNSGDETQLDEAAFQQLVATVRDQYSLILVDCPALSQNSFTMRIASRVDGLILVVESGRVRRQALRHAVDELKAMDARLLGVVLNKRRYPIPEFIYRRL